MSYRWQVMREPMKIYLHNGLHHSPSLVHSSWVNRHSILYSKIMSINIKLAVPLMRRNSSSVQIIRRLAANGMYFRTTFQ